MKTDKGIQSVIEHPQNHARRTSCQAKHFGGVCGAEAKFVDLMTKQTLCGFHSQSVRHFLGHGVEKIGSGEKLGGLLHERTKSASQWPY